MEWIPKGLSTPEAKDMIGYDIMRCKKLFESDFEDAVINGYDDIKQEMIKTTVHLPAWLRKEVSMCHIDHDIGESKLYTAMANHGTSILQYNMLEHSKGVQGARRVLLDSDNTLVVSIVQEFSISVNGIGKGVRRTINIPIWCRGYLASIGADLRMEFSSLIRLVMYLSIQSYNEIKKSDKDICLHEISQFGVRMQEYQHVCNCLISGEPYTNPNNEMIR